MQTGKQDDKQYESLMGSLFKVIFAANRKGKVYGKETRDKADELSGLSYGLFQILLNPGLYPVNQALGELDGLIDKSTSLVDLELKSKGGHYPGDDYGVSKASWNFRFGVSSLFRMINDPRGFAKQGYNKYKAQRIWASIGGATNNAMDGALFAAWAKKRGLSFGESLDVGRAFADRPIYEEDHAEYQEKVAKLIALQEEKALGVLKNKLQEAFLKARAQEDKDKRLDEMQKLVEAEGASSGDAANFAERVFGKRGDDSYGILSTDKPEVRGRSEAMNLLIMGGKKGKPAGKIEAQILKNYLGGLSSGGMLTPGASIGKMIFTGKWLADGIGRGQFFTDFIMGDFAALRLVKDKDFKLMANGSEVLDEDGKPKTLKLMVPQESPMGKISGSLYYYHPANILRGLWDGSFWLKLAQRGNTIDSRSLFFLLHKISPGQLLAPTFKFLREKVINVIIKKLGIKTLLAQGRKLLKKALKVLLNGIPGGGIVAGFLMDLIGEKVMMFMLEIGILVLFGLASLVVIAFHSPSAQQYLSF